MARTKTRTDCSKYCFDIRSVFPPYKNPREKMNAIKAIHSPAMMTNAVSIRSPCFCGKDCRPQIPGAPRESISTGCMNGSQDILRRDE